MLGLEPGTGYVELLSSLAAPVRLHSLASTPKVDTNRKGRSLTISIQVDSGTGAALVNLRDPSDLLIYEMHQYLDADGSGTHDACVSPTVGAERVASATQWLRQNKKRGIIGETAGADNAVCIAAIRGELQHLLDNSDVWAGWLWWAAGPWWGEYMFNMEPPEGIAYQNILPQIEEFVGA